MFDLIYLVRVLLARQTTRGISRIPTTIQCSEYNASRFSDIKRKKYMKCIQFYFLAKNSVICHHFRISCVLFVFQPSFYLPLSHLRHSRSSSAILISNIETIISTSPRDSVTKKKREYNTIARQPRHDKSQYNTPLYLTTLMRNVARNPQNV